MDGADVHRPVDALWVEVEGGLIARIERIPHSHQTINLIDRLAFGVQAVELHVFEGAIDLGLLLLQVRSPRRLLAAQRQCLQHALRLLRNRLRALQLFLDPTTCGELPLGHFDRLAFSVVQRVLGEPGAHVVDQCLVLQRVDPAAGDLRDRRSAVGADRSNGDDRGNDDVNRDDIDCSFRYTGELLQQAACVTEDDWLGHAEAADPSRERFGERTLDDAWAHDVDGHVALHFGERLLAECFCVRVRVWPTNTCGARTAGFDELRLHPRFAQALSLGRKGRAARSAEFLARFRAKANKFSRGPTAGLDVAA